MPRGTISSSWSIRVPRPCAEKRKRRPPLPPGLQHKPDARVALKLLELLDRDAETFQLPFEARAVTQLSFVLQEAHIVSVDEHLLHLKPLCDKRRPG